MCWKNSIDRGAWWTVVHGVANGHLDTTECPNRLITLKIKFKAEDLGSRLKDIAET